MGPKRHSYSVGYKLKVAQYAVEHSLQQTANHFGVDKSMVTRWKQDQHRWEASGSRNKKRIGESLGRKLHNDNLEIELVAWIHERRERRLRVTYNEIRQHALQFSSQQDGETEFRASHGWLEKFLRRNGFSLRRKTTEGQKDPEQLVEKLVSFVLHVSRMRTTYNVNPENIFLMDECAVWFDSSGNTTVETTGRRTVGIKTTGHEKANVTVCLTVSASGQKLMPYIVFKGGSREAQRLDTVRPRRMFLSSSASGWFDQDVTLDYLRRVIPHLAFCRQMIVWDSFRCHISEATKTILRSRRILNVIIPGGCTGYVQVADVSLNKPLKESIRQRYHQWMASDDHTFTAQGNMRAPSKEQLVQWVVESWEEIPRNLILRSMKACGITNAEDGSEDHLIHCFKEDEPASAGKQILAQRRQNDDSSESGDCDDEQEVILDSDFDVDLDAGSDSE